MVSIRDCVDDLARTADNLAVMDHLKNGHAHGDLVELFFKELSALTNVQTHALSASSYPSIFAFTNDSIFAFISGMQSISLRIPERIHALAMENGALPNREIGHSEWFDFPVFHRVQKPSISHWIGVAHTYALASTDADR